MSEQRKDLGGSFGDLLRWLRLAPPRTSVDAAVMLARLEALDVEDPPGPAEPAAEHPPNDWRVRLWEVHPECRMHVDTVAEALGKSRSWVY